MTNILPQFFELAKATGMTSREIGEYLGVNSSTVKRWRNGSHPAPKMACQALLWKLSENKSSQSSIDEFVDSITATTAFYALKNLADYVGFKDKVEKFEISYELCNFSILLASKIIISGSDDLIKLFGSSYLNLFVRVIARKLGINAP